MYHFINDNFHTDIATVPPSYKMKLFHEHKQMGADVYIFWFLHTLCR